MIKKLTHISFLLLFMSLSFDMHASFVARFKKLSNPAQLAAAGAAAYGTFIAYHEAGYHYNHQQVLGCYDTYVQKSQTSPLYKKNNFYLASGRFAKKAAEHYQYSLVTRALQENGVIENKLGVRYTLTRLNNGSLAQMRLHAPNS